MDFSIIAILLSLVLSLLCCAGAALFFIFILGFILLRRRGKKKITAKEAVKAGAESVSQVFVRGKGGGLEGAEGDDDKDD